MVINPIVVYFRRKRCVNIRAVNVRCNQLVVSIIFRNDVLVIINIISGSRLERLAMFFFILVFVIFAFGVLIFIINELFLMYRFGNPSSQRIIGEADFLNQMAFLYFDLN